MRGVEAVVGDGVAEYAELPTLKGGQCGLLKEIILLNQIYSKLSDALPREDKISFIRTNDRSFQLELICQLEILKHNCFIVII